MKSYEEMKNFIDMVEKDISLLGITGEKITTEKMELFRYDDLGERYLQLLLNNLDTQFIKSQFKSILEELKIFVKLEYSSPVLKLKTELTTIMIERKIFKMNAII